MKINNLLLRWFTNWQHSSQHRRRQEIFSNRFNFCLGQKLISEFKLRHKSSALCQSGPRLSVTCWWRICCTSPPPGWRTLETVWLPPDGHRQQTAGALQLTVSSYKYWPAADRCNYFHTELEWIIQTSNCVNNSSKCLASLVPMFSCHHRKVCQSLEFV